MAGNSQVDVITVTYAPPDTVVPVVAITVPTSGGTFATTVPTIDISGFAGDDTGVTQVTCSNDRGGACTVVGTATWTVAALPLSLGLNIITIMARDGAANTAAATIIIERTSLPLPAISIQDVTVTEGNSGTMSASFVVTLSAASGQTVTVSAVTANGTATAPSDYLAAGPTTLTFAPGQTTKVFVVTVNGDTLDEANETFTVGLSGATNATISDNSGLGTITDDDAPPSLSINDVTVTEGNSGTVSASFTVSLSAASGQTVMVEVIASDLTAVAGADYTPTGPVTLTFAPGVAVQTFTVPVLGDTAAEATETFQVTLSNPANATILDGVGVGTITNDDIVVGTNTAAVSAKVLNLESTSRDAMSNVRTEVWYRVRLFAGRSYQFSAWPVDHEQGADAPALALGLFSNHAGTLSATPAPTLTSGGLEGSSNNNGDALPVSMLFQPSTTGVYKLRITRTSGGAVLHPINVAVRETTLFSPWTSRAAGFEGSSRCTTIRTPRSA